MKYFKLFLGMILFFGSILRCGDMQKKYIFATGPESTSYFKVGKSISQIVNMYNDRKLETWPVYTDEKGARHELNAVTNLQLLREGKVDFAIVQNDVSLELNTQPDHEWEDSGIRSVIPLYPEVLFILHNETLTPRNLRELIVGHRIAIGPRRSGTANFVMTFLQEFGIDSTQYQTHYVRFDDYLTADSIDVSCYVTGIDNARIQRLLDRNRRKARRG